MTSNPNSTSFIRLGVLSGNTVQVIHKPERDSKRHQYRVSFPTAKEELRGFEVLMDSGIPTHSTADDKYIINETQYRMLKKQHIEFHIN